MVCRLSLFPGLQLHHSSLYLCHHLAFSCVSMSSRSRFLRRTPVITDGLGAPSTSAWLHLNYLHLQPPYVQIRSYCEVLGVRTSTYLFWSDIIQLLTPGVHGLAVKSLLRETVGILGSEYMKQVCREGSESKTNETHFAILPQSLVAVISPCWFWCKDCSYWWQHLTNS